MKTTMPSLLRRFSCALGLLTLASACDTTGIHPLLRERDIVDACSNATSTWLRSTDTGTEVYLVGSMVPTAPVPGALPLCFVRGFVEHDSSTQLSYGLYTLDGSGNGQFFESSRYTFEFQPSIGILSRDGASREDFSTPVAHAIQIQASGGQLLITEDGATRRLTNLYDLVAQLDATTLQGAEELWRVLNLPLFLSQVRVDGFGSGRMTTYVNNRTFFQGLIANDFSVAAKSFSDPDTTISYAEFQDLSGIVVAGDQVTDIHWPSINGDGAMTGILDWSMRDGPDAMDVRFVGTIDYGNITIDNGMAGGGTYRLQTTLPTVTDHAIRYDLANDMDLRGVLPPSSP